jgi:hypothetical protein
MLTEFFIKKDLSFQKTRYFFLSQKFFMLEYRKTHKNKKVFKTAFNFFNFDIVLKYPLGINYFDNFQIIINYFKVTLKSNFIFYCIRILFFFFSFDFLSCIFFSYDNISFYTFFTLGYPNFLSLFSINF